MRILRDQLLSGDRVLGNMLFTDVVLAPAGLAAGAFGATLVATLQVGGLAQWAAGTASVEIDSVVRPQQWTVQTAVGTPSLQHSRRDLVPTGVAPAGFGTAAATHWLQRADVAGLGPGPAAPPAPVVTDSPRTVSVPWSSMLAIGAHMVGFDREVQATGHLATLFGLTTVRDNSQTAQPPPFLPDAPPAPTIYLMVRTVRPGGFRAMPNDERYGEPLVNNEDQQVTLVDSWERERIWAVPNPSVALWDRPMWPIGLWAGEVSTRVEVSIPNPPARPAGLFQEAVGTAFVSHDERTIDGAGDDMARFGAAAAYNDARVLSPAGLSAGAFGTAAVRNDLRFVVPITSNDVHTVFGTGFIADAERTLAQGTEWSVRTYFGAARVSLWEHYITPAGMPWPGAGGHYAEPHQNRVINSGINYLRIGSATARRVSLDPIGFHTFADGQPRIYRDPEYLSVHGLKHDLHGIPLVYHRNRTLWQTNPVIPPAVPLTHQVRNEIPDPPGERTILASGGVHTSIGTPTAQANQILPGGILASRFGEPTLTGTGISVPSVPPPGFGEGGQIGFPAVPGTQWATPAGDDWSAVGTPRLSPHTILGPVGRGDGHTIDFYVHGGRDERPSFGATTVLHEDRTVRMTGVAAGSTSSLPVVSNWVRTLNMSGLRSWRVGIAKLPAGIPVETTGADMALFGAATVARPDDLVRTVSPLGAAPAGIGTHEAQNLIRTVTLTAGIDAATFGTQWVDRAVRTLTCAGAEHDQHGEHEASHYVRTLALEGWDSAEVTHAPGETRWRMRVTRGPAPATPAVLCSSIDTGAIGAAGVAHFERTLHCGGLFPPQVSVPAPVAAGQNAVLPHGSGASLDHMACGTPAMWTPGDPLVPFAVDFATVGSARAVPVATPASVDAFAAGTASMVRPIDAIAVAIEQYGAHLVAHGDGVHVCGQLLRGIRPGLIAAGGIGSHGVAHD